MTTLVVGGAGYIGGHLVDVLLGRGRQVVVVDDLSTGTAARVPRDLICIDVAHPSAVVDLEAVIREFNVRTVVHLAARKDVGESLARPMYYFSQNVSGVAFVLEAMQRTGVRSLVFSSTAAVYGDVEGASVSEDAGLLPVNPYGESKLACEWLIRDATRAWPLRAIALRYFNVAGAARRELADTGGENLVSKAVAAARDGREVTVFGDDYDTPDGTCVRDYIHVVDLAEAHVLAVERLEKGSVTGMEAINVGTGVGASVREMLEALRRSGIGLRMRAGARRPGDPARVVADTARAKELLGWTARHTLEQIATSAWLAPESRDRG